MQRCTVLALTLESPLRELQLNVATHCSKDDLRSACTCSAFAHSDLLRWVAGVPEHAWSCRVTVAEHTRNSADVALAALQFEQQCLVHQLVEPMTTAGFLAMAGADSAFGVSATPPGVAVITLYSKCTSIQVQVSCKNASAPQPGNSDWYCHGGGMQRDAGVGSPE